MTPESNIGTWDTPIYFKCNYKDLGVATPESKYWDLGHPNIF